MISRKTTISIAVGSAVGVITFMAESALVGILPPLGGVTWWWPNTVLLLLALGMGIACGLVVHVFTRFPKRFVLAGAICAYALIEIAVTVFLMTSTPPENAPGSWLFAFGAITLAHGVAFSIGAVVSYIALGKHLSRASKP